ncbi:uncharacterized protein I303_101628 [Kwoniella dejecticola CBS 10117]|uniref:Uncharacterized protein n=1 Tax=Kwoniella dejecticola CBS 10117 TaxID=1296121 RepID=A0A1A6AD91_9TREE|nr:uncharacterized protein I303_02236 [Kwoniella dejecticola CBS 10117]OBR88019.1 hypothetical protein I303_02236 [Kwoniella dejecticola CBS 10117]
MSSLACSPSTSSIRSYQPTSPLSRPGSPLSGSYIKSRSTPPFPSYSRTTKSKSISSIPPQSIHRLIDTNYPICQAGPSHSGSSTLTRSSSFQPSHSHSRRSTARPRILQDENTIPASNSNTLSRSSSVRSVRSRRRPSISGTISPSRLPSTDCVSYFPPFEDMGSTSQHPNNEDVICPKHQYITSSEGLPVDTGKIHHVKGRSLGSIAGIMSASLSWGLSSLSCPSPPIHSETEKKDDHFVKALTETISNAQNGKRRVLEPFTLASTETTANPIVSQTDASSGLAGREKMHKRRMKSEFEVDMVLSRSHSLGGRSARASQRGRKGENKIIGEEDVVENVLMVDAQAPSRGQSTRRPRPNLRLPIPALGSWRFPLGPSSPVTCLSPDIPLEAFSTAIDNPCLLTPSRTAFSHQEQQGRLSTMAMSNQEEIDLVDCGLSPSPTSPSSFEYSPSTPPKSDPADLTPDEVSIKRLSPSSCWADHRSDSDSPLREEELDLRRIGSRTSEMSCETVKQDWRDITPKPSKIVRSGEA